MPGIPRPILNSVFYLYPSEQDALNGAKSGATGFFALINSKSPKLPIDSGHLYAVTNAHAIEGLCTFARVNSLAGSFKIFQMTVDKWTFHPKGDDVAVSPMGVGSFGIHNDPEILSATVPEEMFISEEDIEKERISPGDEAFFIGRYANHGGTKVNTPTVRFGSVSQVDGEPVFQKRAAGPRLQESILVEARSLSGYSGSPVFAYRGARLGTTQGEKYKHMTVIPQGGLPLYFLGVDWGHHSQHEPVRDKDTDKVVSTGEYVEGNSGMAMIVPAWKLLQVLMDPQLVEDRDKAEAIWLRNS